MMRARVPGFALALALGACSPKQPAGPPRATSRASFAPATANETASVASSATPPPAGDGEPQADAIVARALSHAARLRELPELGPVKGRTIGRAEMVAHVKRQLHAEIPERVILAQNEMLFALGTVSASFDYEKSLLELMSAQLAGFYEPKEKTMYLAEDLVGVERDATLAHELVHALQDQHYDLEHRLEYRDDASDEQSAIHALAEGDATSAMLDHVLSPRGMRATDMSDDMVSLEARGSIEMSPGSANVPSILKRSVVAPYVDGLVFVHWARRRGGWAAVDTIWKNPPTTTEQLLHPDKLAAHEVGDAIPVPVAFPTGPSEVIYRDIQGEQSIRLLFEEWMGRKLALEAGLGWDGDRVAVFRDGSRFALAWHMRYDDEAGAKRGLEAFARGILRAPDAKADDMVGGKEAHRAAKSGSVCRVRPGSGAFAALLKKRELVVVGGPYERTADGPKGRSQCPAALKWAAQIAQQN